MARPKKGTKSIDGSWVFSDFSKGLYLLNTPRNIGEQLYSLAMVSGRNCWSEKGALVSQNGYLLKDRIPEEEIITGYSRTTDGMNNIFITTQFKIFIINNHWNIKFNLICLFITIHIS